MRPDIRPMLATLTDKPFDDPDWIFETKWDGFRAVAVVAPGKAKLYSRNGLDISRKYPSICDALAKIKESAVLDGELVALDAHGRSRFQLLQNAEREPTRLLYCVFDLLYLDGKDMRKLSLIERKAALKAILPKSKLLLYSAHVAGRGIKEFEKAKRAGEEGVMAKLASSRYYSGIRTRDWLKVKAHQEQEVVIVGFTAPRRSRKYFGALLLAVREDGAWAYVGRAGTGFDAAKLRDIYALMVPLITDKKPVAAKVPDEAHTTWVKPKLVAEVKFTEWTTGGEMRHRCFWACAPTRRRVTWSANCRRRNDRLLARRLHEGHEALKVVMLVELRRPAVLHGPDVSFLRVEMSARWAVHAVRTHFERRLPAIDYKMAGAETLCSNCEKIRLKRSTRPSCPRARHREDAPRAGY
jgi:bifunctional non-homologous end joining protein LigD